MSALTRLWKSSGFDPSRPPHDDFERHAGFLADDLRAGDQIPTAALAFEARVHGGRETQLLGGITLAESVRLSPRLE